MATRKIEQQWRVDHAVAQGTAALTRLQSEEGGGFDLGFDGGAPPDAHLVFVASALGQGDEGLKGQLVRRLLDRQLAEGGWALAPGMAGHLSTSVEAYLALRAAGLDGRELPLARARRFIESEGGLAAARGPTRITLALLGLGRWSETMIPPPEIALLPVEAPVSLFRVGALLRLHLLPLMVLRALETVVMPALGRAVAGELSDTRFRAGPPSRPGSLRSEALAACERLMIERLDEDGSLGGLLMATGWAALAAEQLRLGQGHPLVQETVRGLRSFVHGEGSRGVHARVCRPVVRSTALGLRALRSASGPEAAIARGREYLLANRADERGDFELLGPRGPVAAWSIKPRSRRFPSLLDTVYAVVALSGLDGTDHELTRARGWIASMQRRDGGFGLFDRDAATAPWFGRLSLGLLTHTLNDESSPEVTGRVLEASTSLSLLDSRQTDRAVAFLCRSQCGDGSWRGPFSVGALRATSAALAGLGACQARGSSQVARGVEFLLAHQRSDGGWGESPCSAGEYVDLGRSTPSQTALALLGLRAAAGLSASAAIERAQAFLLWTQEPDGSWEEDDPTSASLADVVHLADPVDRLAWPLLALA